MIEQLELTNFKNFRSATLPLGKFTVIVGTNASGKSNIRDAFRFLHGISRGYSLAEIIGEKWGSGGERQWAGIRGGVREIAHHREVEFALRLSIDQSGPTSFSIKVATNFVQGRLSAQPPVVVEESFSSPSDGGYEAAANSEDPLTLAATRIGGTGCRIKLPSGKSTMPFIGDESNTLLVGPFGEALSRDLLLRVFSTDTPANQTRKLLQLMRFFDLSPDALRVPSMPGQTVLGDRGENLSSVLLAISEDASLKAAVLEWVRQLTPLDVVDFDFEPDAAGRVLVALVEGNGKKTSAYSASDGTLRFLAMLAALYGPNAAGFYFFDEIETGIHPTRLHLLTQLIEQRVARGDVQVVATTHSPQLLGLLSEESREAAVLTYRLEGHPEGRIKRIMDIPNAAEVLKNQSLMRLHESGWLENAVEFLEGEEGDE